MIDAGFLLDFDHRCEYLAARPGPMLLVIDLNDDDAEAMALAVAIA